MDIMITNKTEKFPAMLSLLACLLMAASGLAQAEGEKAGKVVYAHGKVWAVDKDKSTRVLNKGDQVYAGDTIVTRNKSLTQVRMVDKGYVSLRPNSQFRINEFKVGKDKEEDVGFFSLLKGGFRAVTGIIGKRKRSSYRVSTSIATIGIRGTDYTARLCNDDCGSNIGVSGARGDNIENGLYVGVLDGGVTLGNRLGQVELERLHYGFVKDAASAPRALLDAPKFLFFKSSSPDAKDEDEDADAGTGAESGIATRASIAPPSEDALSAERQGSDINSPDGVLGDEQINAQTSFTKETEEGDSLNDPSQQASLPVAFGAGPYDSSDSYTSVSLTNSATLDDNGFVEGFTGIGPGGVETDFAIGTASNVDLGLDPDTGIRWGRWSGGTATANEENLNLNNQSLHWVSGPAVLDTIALPSSGTANYTLVGNTTPTDNRGNAGVLGTASLEANFNNMTVDTSVAVGINNRVWNGSASGVPINASGQYNGNMSVDVNSGQFTGSGRTSGFFTNNAAGSGMTYSMDADINGTINSITGSAVFKRQ